ncbi:hypothetical protein FN846DRAFT_927274 [Sphaerosporella brunnea]|uniref:Uncharacterized protein n=1 Tax=Sphaerosporella brunnea TaxID=1250544 RepID=A0A5J5FBD7_9PEZI|nr:hypothetical protein FN846DRAFT_927274 [Sphaerosporella brunnea]
MLAFILVGPFDLVDVVDAVRVYITHSGSVLFDLPPRRPETSSPPRGGAHRPPQNSGSNRPALARGPHPIRESRYYLVADVGPTTGISPSGLLRLLW